MSDIDIEQLLGEIGPESPSGEDLSYDPAFLELEGLIQGGSGGGGMIEAGDGAAEEPNWGAIRKLSLELSGRTKHLRVYLYLCLGLLKTDGFSGLRDGLSVLQGSLERYWDTLHPQLDPEDNNDPLERMNIIASLAPPPGSFQDPLKFKQRAGEAPLCNSAQMGRFCYRDIQRASGEIEGEGGEGGEPDMAVIDAAFNDTDSDALQQTHQAILDSIGRIKAIEEFLNTQVGIDKSPNLDGFRTSLTDIQKRVQDYLARRGYGAAAEEGTGAAAAGPVAGGAEGGGGQPLTGEINSPQDVSMALDKICKYYERSEPSSPIPLMLRRAQKLVSKNFIDIIRDMAPDAMGKIQDITGVDGGGSDS